MLPRASASTYTLRNLGILKLFTVRGHDWYKKRFENYPKDRRAIIPYVL